MTEFAKSDSPPSKQSRKHTNSTKRRDTLWDTPKACAACSDGWMQRVHRETFSEFLLSCFGFYPFICSNCFVRSYRLRWRQLAGAACLGIVALGLMGVGVTFLRSQYKQRQIREINQASRMDQSVAATSAVAPKPSGAPATGSADDSTTPVAELLNNQDIVKMVQSGMTTTVICSLIERARTRFQLDDMSVKQLQWSGVPERVIAAMREAAGK